MRHTVVTVEIADEPEWWEIGGALGPWAILFAAMITGLLGGTPCGKERWPTVPPWISDPWLIAGPNGGPGPNGP